MVPGSLSDPKRLVTCHAHILPSPAMASSPLYLTSDVHLGAVPRETERAFQAWLQHCGEDAAEVVINGDLFDFWFEYGAVIPRGYTRILGALAALVDAGVRVRLVGGNHDWWGGSFLEQEIGVEFLRDPAVVDLAGRRTFLAHGDGLGSGDLGYRILRLLLRSRPTRLAFRWLHPDLGAKLARRVSKTEGRTSEPPEKQQARSRFLEEWAIRRLADDETLDLVVLGHTHVPVLQEVEPGRFYLNPGDWVIHQGYAVLEQDQPPRLLEWDGPGG